MRTERLETKNWKKKITEKQVSRNQKYLEHLCPVASFHPTVVQEKRAVAFTRVLIYQSQELISDQKAKFTGIPKLKVI